MKKPKISNNKKDKKYYEVNIDLNRVASRCGCGPRLVEEVKIIKEDNKKRLYNICLRFYSPIDIIEPLDLIVTQVF